MGRPRVYPAENRDALLFAVLMATREPGLAQAYVRGRLLERGSQDAR